MGASQSTAADEGITVVYHGAPASAAQQDDVALLAQLAALAHSLPLLPDSVAETGSTWTRALQRTLASGSSSSSSSSAAVAPAAVPRLSGDPLERLVADYQRYSRWHCRRIVEKQERLNAAIPLVEQQAARLQHRLAEAGRSAAAAQRTLPPAVAEAKREVEAMAARLARLQQALAEVEEAVERQQAVQQAAAQQAAQQVVQHAAEGEAAGHETPNGGDDAGPGRGEVGGSEDAGEGVAGSSWNAGGGGSGADLIPVSSPAADASLDVL